MKSRVLNAICSSIVILLLAGCGNTEEVATENEVIPDEIPRVYVIGLSPLTLQLEYYVSYVQSMRTLANRQEVDLVIVDSLWNTSKQIADINRFIFDGVDAIICSPTDPDLIKPVLLKALGAGIPVVVEMTEVEGVYPLVGTDQSAGGRLAGEYAGNWLNENYGGTGNVVILDFPYFKNIRDRVEGFEEGLRSTAPKARILARIDTKAKYETAMKAMDDLLESHDEIHIVFGINDDSAKGANAAFENSDIPPEDVCILGFDADRGAIKLIEAGRYLKGSVAANTDKIAEACIETAINLIENEAVPSWVEVHDAQYLVLKENVSRFNNE